MYVFSHICIFYFLIYVFLIYVYFLIYVFFMYMCFAYVCFPCVYALYIHVSCFLYTYNSHIHSGCFPACLSTLLLCAPPEAMPSQRERLTQKVTEKLLADLLAFLQPTGSQLLSITVPLRALAQPSGTVLSVAVSGNGEDRHSPILSTQESTSE